MWRYSLLLLFLLPPVAIVLNHDLISALLMIGWTALVIPLCIVQAIDYCRNSKGVKRTPVVNFLLKAPIAVFGALAFLMGAAIVAWCIYNIFVRRLPEYSGPIGVLGLLFGGFGVAPSLMAFGWYLLRLSVGRVEGTYKGIGGDTEAEKESDVDPHQLE